ncbi:glyoxalase [Enterococcus florum]|uniref:Glyoxalase n=1 Tax=Enterococcus florum TaxID=2480627 RepID=A0A4P5P7V9_9ENTE|nr:VOC family protein [Enterococcus florum]GCF94075.1 glyoxalase [Enterococcus florum]
MQFGGVLLAVSDMTRAKQFYEEVMEQKIVMDLDNLHVAFEGGFSLQANYETLLEVPLEMKSRPDNVQIYFEVEDLKAWETKLSAIEGIAFLHHSKEYPWGQRVMRFYDYDQFIVEVAESMTSVVKRFLAEGRTVEETAERTMFPIEFVQQCNN